MTSVIFEEWESPTAPQGATRKGAIMAALTTTQAEADVRAFAQQFPTPNTLRALALCESGRITWEQVAALFARSLGAALAT
jgi:hypothetical protein